jgi:hypothetical protein
MSYLRFSPAEYRAIAAACRSVMLSDDFFPAFPAFLATALTDTQPDLARRIARFRRYQLGMLFEDLKGRRPGPGVEPGPGREAAAGAGYDLTGDELEAVAQAGGSFLLLERFRAAYRNFLVRRLGRTAPDLSRKLAGFSDRQIGWLCHQVQGRRKRGG